MLIILEYLFFVDQQAMLVHVRNEYKTELEKVQVWQIYHYIVLCLRGVIVLSSNPAHGEMHPVQHYMILCVSDLKQVNAFL